MQKPFGIVLTTLYTAFAGVFSVYLPIKGIVETTLFDPSTIEQINTLMGVSIVLLTCVVYYGLWTMSPWGLWLGRIYYVISISLSIICILYFQPRGNIININVFLMLAETWILSYLFQIDCSMSVQCWRAQRS